MIRPSLSRALLVGAFALAPVCVFAQRGSNPPVNPPQGRGPLPQQRIMQVFRQQLQLNDAQASKLQETNRRYQEQRNGLFDQERQARATIREILCGGDSTRSADLSRSIDQLIDAQKQRLTVLENEQKELSGFLTPYQRARYIGLAEQLQRRLDDPTGMRGGRGGRGVRAGPPPGGEANPGGPPPDACAAPPDVAPRRGRGRGGF